MKSTLSVFRKRGKDSDAEHRWPKYMFRGRVRTSTLLLIIAFFAVWWVYETYRPEPAPKPPAQQVVPPGFVPDPNYTWVPRSRLQQPTPTATPTTTTPTTSPPPPPVTTTTTTRPGQLPSLPCVLPAPFCPPSTSPPTPAPQLPQPGPGPAPSSPPPAS